MFLSCSKKIYVDDILIGKNLNQAKEISLNDFFSKRMQNKIRKINVGNWDILYQNTDFVYIGYPYLKSIFSGKRIIDTLYKINTEVLNLGLPNYKNIEGFLIQQKIYEIINQYQKNNNPNVDFYFNENLNSKLTQTTIEIEVYISYQNNEKEFFTIILDKNTLDKISIIKSNNK